MSNKWSQEAAQVWKLEDVDVLLAVWDKVPASLQAGVLTPLFRAMAAALLNSEHEIQHHYWVNKVTRRGWRALLQAVDEHMQKAICLKFSKNQQFLAYICLMDILPEAMQILYTPASFPGSDPGGVPIRVACVSITTA